MTIYLDGRTNNAQRGLVEGDLYILPSGRAARCIAIGARFTLFRYHNKKPIESVTLTTTFALVYCLRMFG